MTDAEKGKLGYVSRPTMPVSLSPVTNLIQIEPISKLLYCHVISDLPSF